MHDLPQRRLFSRSRPRVWSTEHAARAGFFFALACVAMLGVMSYLSVSRLRTATEWSKHTEVVISTLRLLYSHVADAESSQRGYALGGQEFYLQSSRLARAAADADFQSLRNLTADNASQQRRLDILKTLLAQRNLWAGDQIELLRKQGFAAAQPATTTGIGEQLQEQIRSLVGEMENAEQLLLLQRDARVASSASLADAIIGGGSAVALGVVALALLAIRKDFVRRQAHAAQATLAGRLSRMGSWSAEVPVSRVIWSDAVCAIHEMPAGFSPPLEGALDFYAPEFRETIASAFGDCARDGTPYDIEVQLVTARGHRLWVRAIGEAERNPAGKILRVQGAFQDISDRKLAQEETRQLAERLTTTLESLTDGFLTLDRDFCFTYLNSEAERMFRLSRTDLLGNNIWTIFSEDRGGIFRREYERALRENVAVHFEAYYPPFEAWFDVRAFPSAQGLAVYFRDNTERRRASEALRKAEEDFRTMANHISQLAWMADAQGYIFWYNDRWFDYSGTTLEEMAGWGWQKVHHPDHVDRVVEKIARCFQSGEVWEDTFPLRGRDGTYRWFLSRAVPIHDAEGAILRWFGTNTDVTDNKILEEELAVARDQALESARIKSEFLANMSHEIRTPMNGILGMTELVLETELDPSQREYLGMARTSANSLLGLINDILDFSKIEAGKLELEEISFSLRDCIGAMLKPLGMRADQKGLELTADIPAEIPDHLIGDPMRLRQILVNLTDNAIKFTTQGDVMLRVAIESKTEEAHCFHFSVQDSGIGIPAAKQSLIFDAFSQADGSTTRTYGGTGLGLAIASQLVWQMGGRIWVESTVGEGTTFHFTACLPVLPTPAPDARSADPRRLDGLPVLVVDDNAINRRILREMLASWRMQPVVAASGAEALDEMLLAADAGHPFPLVLLDGMMPQMDGFTVVERIREHTKLKGATVMMLSSAMPAGTATRCGKLGVASYLTKPVGQSELLDAILLALGGAARIEKTGETASDTAPARPPTPGLRILLVEDNLINRTLAAALFEKRGHSVLHAVNGREAIAAAEQQTFDVIFMDVQMPEMDGFEATKRIRKSEQATGRHTPIVAMTAFAMTGDRERCLDAGMDNYISKPLQKNALFMLLDSVVPPPAFTYPQTMAQASSPGVPPIFSRQKLLNDLDGDESLMHRLIALFHENTPRLLDDIRTSNGRRNAHDLDCAAHALLSSLGVFGAEEATILTQQLATQAHEENYEHSDRIFAELERNISHIHSALAALTPCRA